MENILGEHNQYKRHSIAVEGIKNTNSSGKTKDIRITIDKFMNSNVDNESNQQKLVVNLVRRKHLHVIEESENKRSDSNSDVDEKTDSIEENINYPLKHKRSEDVKVCKPIANFETKKYRNTLEVGLKAY